MTKKRIQQPIEFSSEEERLYYQKIARKLGFSSFKDFALSSMNEKIGKANVTDRMVRDIILKCDELALHLEAKKTLTNIEKSLIAPLKDIPFTLSFFK